MFIQAFQNFDFYILSILFGSSVAFALYINLFYSLYNLHPLISNNIRFNKIKITIVAFMSLLLFDALNPLMDIYTILLGGFAMSFSIVTTAKILCGARLYTILFGR